MMMGWQGYDNEGCMPGDRERLLRLRQGMRKRSSTSYTLKEIEALAGEFVDGNNASADQNAPDAIKLRMFIGAFCAWLAKREREGLDGER